MLGMLFTAFGFGQLPDREKLEKVLIKDQTTAEGATQLIKHFQAGGQRTIMRNLPEMSKETRLKYAQMFMYQDLMRFRNTLNEAVAKVTDPDGRAMVLSMLATFGRNLAPIVFEPYANDETAPMKVRLAAMSGMIRVQNPQLYNKFIELCEEANIDPSLGPNDFEFVDISRKNNMGFYLYLRGKLSEPKLTDGMIKAAIHMSNHESVDVYEALLEKVKRKQIPWMIDHAAKVGGVKLLALMETHKKTKKKFATEVGKAKAAAQKVAPYLDKLMGKDADPNKFPLASVVPFRGKGSGAAPGYTAGIGVIRVAADGSMSLVEHVNPFGGSDNLAELVNGKTFPAHADWQPKESYYLIYAY